MLVLLMTVEDDPKASFCVPTPVCEKILGNSRPLCDVTAHFRFPKEFRSTSRAGGGRPRRRVQKSFVLVPRTRLVLHFAVVPKARSFRLPAIWQREERNTDRTVPFSSSHSSLTPHLNQKTFGTVLVEGSTYLPVQKLLL